MWTDKRYHDPEYQLGTQMPPDYDPPHIPQDGWTVDVPDCSTGPTNKGTNMSKLIFTSAVAILILSTGCSGLLEGAGSLRIGMVNSNFVEIGHTVDGDKEGKKAKAEFKVEGSVLDALLPSRDNPSDDVVAPGS